MVIGIIGPPGVGKSTIMNDLYGYDGSSPGTIFVYLYYGFFNGAEQTFSLTLVVIVVSIEFFVLLTHEVKWHALISILL